MPIRQRSIAIVGAGMGGLATAATLTRVGMKVDVYEQPARFERVVVRLRCLERAAGARMTGNNCRVAGVLPQFNAR